MATIVQKLAAYASALRFEDLPPTVVERAKICLLDLLGIALAGAQRENTGIARAVARTATDYFVSLKATGSTNAFRDRMLDFRELNQLLGTPDMLALGKRYDGDS